MIGSESPRPRGHIRVRVDHDCPPEQWRLDCGDCGLAIGRCIPNSDIGHLAISATLQHVCLPVPV